MKKNKAIFLDKDGVFVDSSGYPKIIPTDTYMPEAIEGLKLLAKIDYLIIVFSNQSWIASGRMTYKNAVRVFEKVKRDVKKMGGRIDAYYFCPHDKSGACECRKPNIGMLQKAAEDYNLDLSESYCIGDMTSDIECGKRAGCKTVLVKSGPVAGTDGKHDVTPDYTFANLTEAVKKLFF